MGTSSHLWGHNGFFLVRCFLLSYVLCPDIIAPDCLLITRTDLLQSWPSCSADVTSENFCLHAYLTSHWSQCAPPYPKQNFLP